MRKFIYLILSTFILISCNRSEKLKYETGIILNGKRLYLKYGNNLIIDEGSKHYEIKLIDSFSVKYSKPIWKNNSDEIILIDSDQNTDRIISINTSGEHLDTIFIGNNYFKITKLSISNNDGYLIINGFNETETRNIQTPPVNMVNCCYYIYNFDKEKIEDSVIVSSRPVPSKYNEPILNSKSDKIIIYKNPAIDSWEEYKSGLLYIYDIEKKSFEFIDSSYYATWATSDPNKLFYFKKGEIFSLDLELNLREIIYKAEKREKIRSFRLSPDSKYILVNLHKHSRLLKPLGDKFSITPFSKLISLTKQENYIQKHRSIIIHSWKK